MPWLIFWLPLWDREGPFGLPDFGKGVRVSCDCGGDPIRDHVRPIPEGLVGELRRTVAGARFHIDHSHEEIEFDLVVRGVGSYSLGNHTYELKAGTLMWLAGGQRHRLIRSPKLEMWVVNVRPGLLTAAEAAEIAAQPSRLLPGEELMDLDRLLGQVAQDSDEPETYNAGLSYALRRAVRAGRDCPPAHLKLMHPAVTRALMLLRQSEASFSLSRLAEETGIAPTYLSRLLVEHTNRSFVDWRNRIRLEHFVEDYRPGANLLQAALDAGFGSYARFHHVFSELVGCPPSEWIHRADTALSPLGEDGPAAPAAGVPAALNLSIRHRWMRLVPVASPVLCKLFDDDAFGGNLVGLMAETEVAAGRAEPEGEAQLSLSAQDVELFLAGLRNRSAQHAADFAALMADHDFAGIYAGILRAYALDPAALADGLAAFLLLVWTAQAGAPDPSLEQAAAARRQARRLLFSAPTRVTARAREIRTALLCHFVVIYHALQAARAGGDGRALVQLRDATLSLATALRMDAIAEIRPTDAGFRSA